jgi:cytochrome P450
VDAITRPIIPPAPKVHKAPLSDWRLLLEMTRNNLNIWTEDSFEYTIGLGQSFGIHSAVINDPEGIRHVLATNVGNYRKPIPFLRITRPLAGAGLLTSEGGEWRRQRRNLAPVFTPASIGPLLPHFIGAAKVMADKLAAAPRANLSAAFHDAALDAVLRALFSLPVTDERGGFAAMVRDYVSGVGRLTPFDGFARDEDDFEFATRGRRRFKARRVAAVATLIEARKAQGQTNNHPDVLDLLLAARDPDTGAPLPDAEIGDQTATMLFAGFETTSRLLFWASYLLSLDQVEQSRLRAEVTAFPPDRVTSLDDLQHWPRLRLVLLEALRLYPPVPAMIREAVADDIVLGETIRAKAQVWISPWVVHRHRKYWDQPTAFMPERFAGVTAPWTSMGAFIPFSGGPRICIGAAFAMAEAQIVLATLISRFEFGLESDRPVKPKATLTIIPEVEPWFRLEPVAG